MMKYKDKNYFFITPEKEAKDIEKLTKQLVDSNWMDDSTVIVNCSPDYSSIVSQIVNHKLSYLNKHELFETLDLQMPYPTMSQIWNPFEQEYQKYEYYVNRWVLKYVRSDRKYLFIDSGTIRGSNFAKLEFPLRKKVSIENYRFATLYLQDTSMFAPDYYVEMYNMKDQGGLLFWWENGENPNWNY